MTFAALVAALVLTAASAPVLAEKSLDKSGKLRLQADLRLRFEADWDSKRANGTLRSDRNRLRIRGRLGLTYAPVSPLTVGFRVRTGSTDSQQSPHITIADFDDNPKGDRDLLFDKWFAKFSGERFWVWGGRNSLPFWKQDEFFWDDDVTPAGVAAGHTTPWKGGSFSLNVSYLALPDGGVSFGPQMAAGQGVLKHRAGPVGLTLAGGVFKVLGDSSTRHLRRGNGERDYTLWVANIQTRFAVGSRPVTVGLDLMHNSENYSASDPDPVTAANHDQNNGFASFVRLGQLSQRGDWLAAYYYARIETLAVNASYAQDDWIRWGSATQTDSSDLKGHEFRFAYALHKSLNIVARLYLVQAITSGQDGKRFRLDLNFKF